MKNKGRKHKKAINSDMNGILDCKGMLTHITRPIESMSSNGKASSKFDKKKWSKRVRGYFKSQTKIILD